ncbi:MAG: hypothetical protein WDO73_35105 [Ignavibacteriota bacterium]
MAACRGPANESQTIKQFSDLATQRGIGVSVMRYSAGDATGLASSINLLLPDALATGKLDMVSNAIVREISVDKKTGKADGAHFVDRHSRREMHVKAKVVVLARGMPGEHALAAEFRTRQFSGIARPLSARSDFTASAWWPQCRKRATAKLPRG